MFIFTETQNISIGNIETALIAAIKHLLLKQLNFSTDNDGQDMEIDAWGSSIATLTEDFKVNPNNYNSLRKLLLTLFYSIGDQAGASE